MGLLPWLLFPAGCDVTDGTEQTYDKVCLAGSLVSAACLLGGIAAFVALAWAVRTWKSFRGKLPF